MIATQRIYVRNVSFDNCVGDWEPRVENEFEAGLFEEQILEQADEKEKQIVNMLMDGYNFLEISKKLHLKESQIYKIKRQLADKYRYLHDTNTAEDISVVVKLHVIARLKKLARHIYSLWYADNGLKEYKRPTLSSIEDYVEDVLLEIGGSYVVYRTPSRKNQLYYPLDCQLVLFPEYERSKQNSMEY